MQIADVTQILGAMMQGVQLFMILKDRKEEVELIITTEKYFPNSSDNVEAVLVQLLVHNDGNKPVAVEKIILEINGQEIGADLITEIKTDIPGFVSVVGFQRMFHFKVDNIDTLQPLQLPVTLQPRESIRGVTLFTFPAGMQIIQSAVLRVQLNGKQVFAEKTII